MESINIQVTESMKQFIHDQVTTGKSASPSAFIEDLLKEAKKRELNRIVESLLDEAIASGEPTPVTKEDGLRFGANFMNELSSAMESLHEPTCAGSL